MAELRGEAPEVVMEGSELPMAEKQAESPASQEKLMERVCQRENLLKALKRVKQNKGSPGIDKMSVTELTEYLKEKWPKIREELLKGKYKPQAIKPVEIPKARGGKRQLGIPTVVDRFIQQAILQVLQNLWEPTFSKDSYGFRPGKSAHQAIAQAQRYVREGYDYVVDTDIEKFFDRVNHDLLMERIARKVKDKRLLKLIRAYLTAGVLEGGLVSPRGEGTPQGGPLSPLLSNILLDELDKELERRGHRYVRYADDCNIYVKTQRAGERVMESVKNYLSHNLKLKVNESKSSVGKSCDQKFLGYSFTRDRRRNHQISPEAIKRFRARVRKLTHRARGVSVLQMVKELTVYLRGWKNYFSLCETQKLKELDIWVRKRLRCVIWKQWKTARNRYQNLLHLGVSEKEAALTAVSGKGSWTMAQHPIVQKFLTIGYFDSLGLVRLWDNATA